MLKTLPLKYYFILLLALGLVNVLVYRAISTPKLFEVTVFSVGKGDATLVRSPSGKTLLIDTGSDASILRALGTALPEWQREIDSIILTSASAKSTGGLPDVQNRYQVAQTINTGGHDIPYGAPVFFDTNIDVTVTAPGTFSISHGTDTLHVSSTTQSRTYVLK